MVTKLFPQEMNVVVQMAGADPLLNTAARNASNIHDLSVSM